jgi:sulfite exporter TauE/SafE
MQLCVGTSLAIIVPTAVRSYRAHRATGMVIPEVMRSWAFPGVAGVAVGSTAAALAPGGLLKAAFVAIAGVIATKLLVGREDWVLSDHLPGRLGMTACGFLVGLASSLMGISGGSLATMALTLCQADPQCGRDLRRPRGSDHDRRYHRLCARRPALSGGTAAAVDRLRLGHRRRHDRPDLELCGALRRAARACSAPAPDRDRVWIVSVDRVGALRRKSARADALKASLRPPAAIPGELAGRAGRPRACGGGPAPRG